MYYLLHQNSYHLLHIKNCLQKQKHSSIYYSKRTMACGQSCFTQIITDTGMFWRAINGYIINYNLLQWLMIFIS